MDTYIRFLFEFMSVFFKGIGTILSGIFKGFIQMFNIREYLYVIDFYKDDFTVGSCCNCDLSDDYHLGINHFTHCILNS